MAKRSFHELLQCIHLYQHFWRLAIQLDYLNMKNYCLDLILMSTIFIWIFLPVNMRINYSALTQSMIIRNQLPKTDTGCTFLWFFFFISPRLNCLGVGDGPLSPTSQITSKSWKHGERLQNSVKAWSNTQRVFFLLLVLSCTFSQNQAFYF